MLFEFFNIATKAKHLKPNSLITYLIFRGTNLILTPQYKQAIKGSHAYAVFAV